MLPFMQCSIEEEIKEKLPSPDSNIHPKGIIGIDQVNYIAMHNDFANICSDMYAPVPVHRMYRYT